MKVSLDISQCDESETLESSQSSLVRTVIATATGPSATCPSQLTLPEAAPSTSRVAGAATFQTSPEEETSAQAATELPMITPQYKMAKLSSITNIWKEYAIGLHGGPAVRALEEEWSSRWRQTEQTKKMFQRRKPFYALIEAMAEKWRIPADQAAERLEKRRIDEARSLKWFLDNQPSL